jgi:hypothetical protein
MPRYRLIAVIDSSIYSGEVEAANEEEAIEIGRGLPINIIAEELPAEEGGDD